MLRLGGIASVSAVVLGLLGCGSGADTSEDLGAGENATKENWAIEAVPVEGAHTVTEVSVGVDSKGRVHALAQLVSTQAATQQKLVYAVRETTGWSVRDLAYGFHLSPKIVVDQWDRVHVAYLWRKGDGTVDSVAKYIVLEGNAPTYEEIPTTAPQSSVPKAWFSTVDFVVDDLKRVHFTAKRIDRSLAYAIRAENGVWIGPTDPLTALDSSGPPGEQPPDLSRGFRGAPRIGVSSSTVPSIFALTGGEDDLKATPIVFRYRGQYGWYPEPGAPLSAWRTAFSLDTDGDRHMLSDDGYDYAYTREMRGKPELSGRVKIEGPANDVDPALALVTDGAYAAHVVVVGVDDQLQYGRFVDGALPKQGMSSIPLTTRTWERNVAIAVDGTVPHILATDNVDTNRLKYITAR